MSNGRLLNGSAHYTASWWWSAAPTVVHVVPNNLPTLQASAEVPPRDRCVANGPGTERDLTHLVPIFLRSGVGIKNILR